MANEEPSTFLVRSLEKILSEREIKKDSSRSIEKACKSCIESINKELGKGVARKGVNDSQTDHPVLHNSSVLPALLNQTDDRSDKQFINADLYFQPFELVCYSKLPKLTRIALDCIEKLISYGHLTGVGKDPLQQHKTLIDSIVKAICTCFLGEKTDTNVQLQILKALLAIITSPSCSVHSKNLRKIIRTCINIYLNSPKQPTVNTTAKATLTQMLNVVFQRIETNPVLYRQAQKRMEQGMRSSQSSLNKKDGTETPNSIDNTTILSNSDSPIVHTTITTTIITDTTTTSSSSISDKFKYGSDLSDTPLAYDEINLPTQIQSEIINTTTTTNNNNDGDNNIDNNDIDDTEEIINDNQDIDKDKISNLQDVKIILSIEDLPNATLSSSPTHDDENSQSSPQSIIPLELNDTTQVVDENEVRLESRVDSEETIAEQFAKILLKDASDLFYMLCAISDKQLSELQNPKSYEIKLKVILLELILIVLDNSGPVFRTDPTFINIVREHLCQSLSINVISPVLEVFELAITVFLVVLGMFKMHLKMQIEVFFKDILFNILESHSSSFEHKWIVLQTLTRICSDSQLILDLYINYDCDLGLSNVYEKLINILARTSKDSHLVKSGAGSLQQEKYLRLKGLECLMLTLKCLVDWTKYVYQPFNRENSELNVLTHGVLDPNRNDVELYLKTVLSKKVEGVPRRTTSTAMRLPMEQINALNVAGEVGDTGSNMGDRSPSLLSFDDDPEQYETLKQKKDIMDKGLSLFKRNPIKGVIYIQEQNLIGKEPEDIADFFHNYERLDKKAVGEYLGGAEEINKKTMYSYVDTMDFSNLNLLSALRIFLGSGFRLPGEAQKVDRLMEKFAARYIDTNPNNDIFAGADAAYVLAFSIIMLTTDLHNDQVRVKMTLEDYIKMNRGINESKDLPRKYLENIFHEIQKEEIKMTGINLSMSRTPSFTYKNQSERKLAFCQETEAITKHAQKLIKEAGKRESTFTTASQIDHVRPMFKVGWPSFLSAFSLALKDNDDADTYILCLEGLRNAIRIACIFNMTLERNAFVQSLTKFTLLVAGLSEMKQKNIETIKILASIAFSEGNYLEESWRDVLKVVSQLELAQLIGTGVKPQFISIVKEKDLISVGSKNISKKEAHASMELMLGGVSKDKSKMASVKESMEETSSQSVVVAVDRIFTGSINLDGNAIVDFVRCLCEVSMSELMSISGPRMFSLQKLVEISYYNMGRIRLEWSRIWNVLGEHFNSVGCHVDEDIAIFAIDSLKQLALKFLEKGELANFHFQKDFLRPFQHIILCNQSHRIRDMIIRCISRMVQSQAHNIRSGWKCIFCVLQTAAGDEDENIVMMAFETINTIFTNYFNSTIDSFQDAIKCLSEFACNPLFPDTSMEAIRLIRTTTKQINDYPELFYELSSFGLNAGNHNDCDINAEKVWLKGWMPVMVELAGIMSRCMLDVRTRGLTVMFEIMKTYGGKFEKHWWEELFTLVFWNFDPSKLPELVEKSEWMTTTCNHALYALVDVFTQFFEILSPFLFDLVLDKLLWCVQQENEQLARSGTNCLENLVITNGAYFSEAFWNKTIDCVWRIYKISQPNELISWKPETCSIGDTNSTCSISSHDSSQVVNIIYNNNMVEDHLGQTLSASSEAIRVAIDAQSQQMTDKELEVVLEITPQAGNDTTCNDRVENEREIGTDEPETLKTDFEHKNNDVDKMSENGEINTDITQSNEIIIEGGENTTTTTTNSTTTTTNYTTTAITTTSNNNNNNLVFSDEIQLNIQHFEPQVETLIEDIQETESNELKDSINNIITTTTTINTNNSTNSVEILPEAEKETAQVVNLHSHVADDVTKSDTNTKLPILPGKVQLDRVSAEQSGYQDTNNAIKTAQNLSTRGKSKRRSAASSFVSADQKLFQLLIIKCVVQLELVAAIDHIIFFPSVSRHEDDYIRDLALKAPIIGNDKNIEADFPRPEPKGMFDKMQTKHLFLLIDCLLEGHEFAKLFNSNEEQRTILWKAGFRGKSKPSLMKQETNSLATCLRILFSMIESENHIEAMGEIEMRLVTLAEISLQYYFTLIPTHAENWNNVLLLYFYNLTELRSLEVFNRHISRVYKLIAHLPSLLLTFKTPEIGNILTVLFQKIGSTYEICHN